MLTLRNLSVYTPDEAELLPDILSLATHLQTEDGLDWYYHRTRFRSDTLKIMYDEKNIIRGFSFNAQALWPDGFSVTEIKPEDVPAEFGEKGRWMWDGEKIMPCQSETQDVHYADQKVADDREKEQKREWMSVESVDD